MNSISKTIELHIPNSLGYENIAISAASEVAKMMTFSHDRIDDLRTAVSEACINAIEHGSKNTTKILITLQLDDTKLEVNVHSKSGRFKQDIVKPDIKEKMEGNSPTRGWGMFLIKSLMDEVEFQSLPDNENVTKMVIYIHPNLHNEEITKQGVPQ